MNKIELLKTRRAKLLNAGTKIRKQIAELVDENSFVELDSYSFSKNDFYGEDAEGEGVITGYATINDTSCYVIAQNSEVLSGGISKANCLKIIKCQQKAESSLTPIIYILESQGVQVGEGVNVLEGIAGVLSMSAKLKGVVPQFTVVNGELLGSFALLTANADFNFMAKNSCVAYASPLVISASSGKNVDKQVVGGVKATEYNNLTTFEFEDLSEVKNTITKVLDILGETLSDNQEDLERVSPNLNEKCCPNCLIEATFDNDTVIELNKNYTPEVKTVIGRIGGISVASIIFDNVKEGVELTPYNVNKIRQFASFALDYSLPLVTFVNTVGIKNDLDTSNTLVLKQISGLIEVLSQSTRLNIVYGKAVGLGYSLFASKLMGADYSFAFANAHIALFDGATSSAFFGKVDESKLNELEEKYSEENADPINCAKDGYIDNIIEPQFVRSYVISALQMLLN